MKMSNETNQTDPVGDRTLVKVLFDYIESRGKVSKLALNFIIITSAYMVVCAILPPQYVLWAWGVVMSAIFLLAVGIYVWHETIGVASAMKPVYKMLHRLTGNPYYANLLEDKA